MAEERIIDDDIDRNNKYKIVVDENGEEELIVESNYKEEEPQPVLMTDDNDDDTIDEYAHLTPEQLAIIAEQKEKEEKERLERVALLLGNAKDFISKNMFAEAAEKIFVAEEITTVEEDNELDALKLVAITRGFSSFEDERVLDTAKYVNEHTPNELRNTIFSKFRNIVNEKVESCKIELDGISSENEKSKQENRDILIPEKEALKKDLYLKGGIFLGALICTIICGIFMFAVENGAMLFVTIVLALATIATFIVALLSLREWLEIRALVIANEKDNSTKIGKNYLQVNSLYEKLIAIQKAINSNDIS